MATNSTTFQLKSKISIKNSIKKVLNCLMLTQSYVRQRQKLEELLTEATSLIPTTDV